MWHAPIIHERRHLVIIKSWGIHLKYRCSDQNLQIYLLHSYTVCSYAKRHSLTHTHIRTHTHVSEGTFKHNNITTSSDVITIHHLFVNMEYEWCGQAIHWVCLHVCMCVMRLESSRTFIYSVAGEEIEYGWVIRWHFHKGLHSSLSHSLSLMLHPFILTNHHIW